MASKSVNKCTLLGHLGRDAETTFTPSGAAVTKFSVATTRSWKDQQSGEWKDETNWTNVILWRNEKLGEQLTKGKQVYVEGRLETRSYDDKDTGKKVYTTSVVADTVIPLGVKSEGPADSGNAARSSGGYNRPSSGPSRQSKPAQSSFPPEADPYDGMGITDDDVPF